MSDHLSTSYDRSLSFQIFKKYDDFTLDCRGEFGAGVTAVFGPSGSGKTMMLNCIAGMTSPDSGEVRVGGALIYSSKSRVDVAPEKRRFGYVFQHGALFPHMTVGANVSYGFDLTPASERRFSPDDLAELLGITSLMHRDVAGLSGGERQRVAIARALAVSPRLLLLDEPVSSLDAQGRASILKYLRQVSNELQTPMLYVSHSLSEVLALASHTFALDRGQSIAYGPTPDVMAHPAVARIADFGTLENLLEGEILESENPGETSRLRVGEATLICPPTQALPGESVTVSVRAGDIILSMGAPPLMSARNTVPAVIRELRKAGGRVLVHVDIGDSLVVEITPASASDLALKPGRDVYLVIKTNSILVFRSDSNLETE